MARWLAGLTVGLLMTGCMAHRVRAEAAAHLDCPHVQVVENKEHKSWVAEGCGRRAICAVPDVKGAEVQCAGGASISSR